MSEMIKQLCDSVKDNNDGIKNGNNNGNNDGKNNGNENGKNKGENNANNNLISSSDQLTGSEYVVPSLLRLVFI